MNQNLRIILILFAIFWLLFVTYVLKKEKLPVKYSMFWYLFIFVIILLGLIPDFLQVICSYFGFEVLSNLVIGIFITMLMFITLILTVIISEQKRQLKLLVQEVSILKNKVEKLSIRKTKI